MNESEPYEEVSKLIYFDIEKGLWVSVPHQPISHWSKDRDLCIESLWYPAQRRHELLTGFDTEQRRSNDINYQSLEVGPTHSSVEVFRKEERAKGLDYSECMLNNNLKIREDYET